MIRTTRLACFSAPLLALILGGCGGNLPGVASPSDSEPSFYKHLDASSARVDAASARDMISIYRHNNGAPPVTIDPGLQKVAEAQALAMAKADALSHEVRGTLSARLDAAHVPNRAAVENVSAGYHTLAEAFSGWRQSPHHNENMLNPAMHRMGIATAYAPGSKYKVFWALVMTD